MTTGTACHCGHAIEEHGHDPKYPGSTACTECDCIAYEQAEARGYREQYDTTPPGPARRPEGGHDQLCVLELAAQLADPREEFRP